MSKRSVNDQTDKGNEKPKINYCGQVIGRGGYSTVFSLLNNSQWCVKDNVKQEEANILKSLSDNLHIPTFHDYNPHSYEMTMACIRGIELYQIIKEKAYTEKDMKPLFLQLLNVVSYLHEKNIVHRDIKPENIMVTENRLQLIDFGCAQQKTNTQTLENLTRDRIGTELYNAPELMVRNTTKTTYNGILADAWSCAVVAVVMLMASYPFDNSSCIHKIRLNNEIKFRITNELSPNIKSYIQKTFVEESERISVDYARDTFFATTSELNKRI